MRHEESAYSVLLAASFEKAADFLKGLLPQGLYGPVTEAASAAEARRLVLNAAFDLVIVNAPLSDEFGSEFCLDICEDTHAGVLLLVPAEQFEAVSAKVSRSGVFAVSKPVSRAMLEQTLRLLCAQRDRLRKFEKKNEVLREKMEEIRIVNRAKWVLIDYLKMSETEAHRYIEKHAMDMRITKRAAAERIIRTYEN